MRPVRADDLDALYAIHVAVVHDGRGAVRDTPWTREGVAARVQRFVEGDATLGVLLVAERDGRVVGEIDLKRVGPAFLSHVVVLGLEVHPDHQRQGVGKALMQAAIAWARAHDVRRIELYTRADNDRAIPLYEAFGLVIEGTRRAFVRLPDGTFVDDHVMGLLLEG